MSERVVRPTRSSFQIALCFFGLLWLAGSARASTQTSSVTITGLSIYAGSTGSQGAEILFTPAMPGVEGCGYPAGNVLWIDFTSTSQPDGKSLYATVMAAYLAGRTLAFGVLHCDSSGQFPLVYRVDVGP